MTKSQTARFLLGVSGIVFAATGGYKVAGDGGMYLAIGFAALIVWHANKVRGDK